MRTLRNVFLVIILALSFTGCESLSPIKAFKDKDKQDSLTKTLHNYELTVRWGELNQIYAFLHPDLAKVAKIQDGLEGIRVTSYETVNGPTSTSAVQVMQSVKIRYIYNDRQIEKTMVDNQEWTYNEEKKEWRRTNLIPKF